MKQEYKYTNPNIIARRELLFFAIATTVFGLIQFYYFNENNLFGYGFIVAVLLWNSLKLRLLKRYNLNKELVFENKVLYYNDGKESIKMNLSDLAEIEYTKVDPISLNKTKQGFYVFYGKTTNQDNHVVENGFVVIKAIEFIAINQLIDLLKSEY